MPKRSASQHVPKEMQARFEEITHLTDAFCRTYLNEEYRQLCRELTATLGRKRPSPLLQGKAPTWVWSTSSSIPPRPLTWRPARSGSISN